MPRTGVALSEHLPKPCTRSRGGADRVVELRLRLRAAGWERWPASRGSGPLRWRGPGGGEMRDEGGTR